MSNTVKFFVASREDAIGALEAGPGVQFPMAWFGNFDAEEALLDWEARLCGRSFEELVEDDLPEVIAEIEEGPAIFAVSDALADALGSASNHQIEELVRWWVAEKANDGMTIDQPIAFTILHGLAELIIQKREIGEQVQVYCWTG
ncbi:hypothetical protein [Streptomyces sp. NPDC093261]|uniref:hypothetical protein n=1 Tax=Streptomyces sp. NPDC093261 TaxID=3366037 RepID=UPI0038264384